MSDIRYPAVTVELSTGNGNAYTLIANVRRALVDHLRAEGIPATERQEITTEFVDAATSGDYDHCIQTCMDWVNIA